MHRGGCSKRQQDKQQKTPQPNKNVADSYVPGVFSTLKSGKIAKTDNARWKKSIREEIRSGRPPKLAVARGMQSYDAKFVNLWGTLI